MLKVIMSAFFHLDILFFVAESLFICLIIYLRNQKINCGDGVCPAATKISHNIWLKT